MLKRVKDCEALLNYVKQLWDAGKQGYLCNRMNRKVLVGVILLMAAALLGLIFVQGIWISNAISMRQEQFGQLISNSLINVASDIERNETVHQVLKEIRNPLPPPPPPPAPLHPGHFSGRDNGVKRTYKVIIQNQQYFARSKDEQGKQETYYFESGNANVAVMHQDSISPQEIYSYVTIVPADSTTPYSIIRQLPGDSSLTAFEQDTNRQFESPGMYRAVNRKILHVENIIDKMIRKEGNIRERISPRMIRHAIEAEFERHGILLDYEYSVTDAGNSMFFHSSRYDTAYTGKVFTTRLFPDDVFSKPYYLAVYFPGEAEYLKHSVSFMEYSSAILTLIIFISFAVTLFIILRQKKLSEIKNDFVNNMTHELKTPISTISLASQMLNDPSIPLESKNLSHITGIIANESKRLGFQVEKVLQMAIFDKGKIHLKLKEVDIHALIEGVINNFNVQISKRNGIIRKDLQAEKAFAALDEVHFTNLIVNLLDNAVKYCNTEPDILVSTRNNKNFIIISVKDNGIGIARNYQKRIFEKFYRVPTGNIHNVKGFGLGLSYVKKIGEAHGGKVSFDSEPGKGSTFHITVPLIKEIH